MTRAEERLYALLPAIHRIRDLETGEPLRALLSIIQEVHDAIDDDLDRLYDDWFIETCGEWVLPYIGDLLSVRAPAAIDGDDAYSLRAYVANTLRYRRRKGTAPAIEEIARDVTGWTVRVVEFFQHLVVAQHVNHVRIDRPATPDLRNTGDLERTDGPFNSAAHNAEVRTIDRRHGKWNIPNIGIFAWRLRPYPVALADAGPIDAAAGRYCFSPLGVDAPLFNFPETEAEITHLAEPRNTPEPLRRRAVWEALAGEVATGYFNDAGSVFAIYLDGSPGPAPIQICDLSTWRRPTRAGVEAAVDPELGRITLPEGSTAEDVQITYVYGFSGDVGAGPYDRTDAVAEDRLEDDAAWRSLVTRSEAVTHPVQFTTLADAIAAWNAEAAPDAAGVIIIGDSRRYDDVLPEVELPAGATLLIAAGSWTDPDQRPALTDAAPHVESPLSVRAVDGPDAETASLTLCGGLWRGATAVAADGPVDLTLLHATLLDHEPSLPAVALNAAGSIQIRRSIVRGVTVAGSADLSAVDSIIAGEIAAPDARAELESVTVVGAVAVREIEASNTIFQTAVVAERRQAGCVRYSHVPTGSVVPRRYRCQPALAQAGVTGAADRARIAVRMQPQFNSVTLGAPDAFQLAEQCAAEIRTGAEDGSEMGAFRFLQQPQRESNLRTALDEYLPFGLRAGLFYVT